MDEREGARREVIQLTKNGIKGCRGQADLYRRMARSYAARAAGVTALPVEVLEDYAAALREEAECAVRLADVMQAEIESR
jgi:hypothetical protein